MKLRESLHNELVSVYNQKSTTIQERYEKRFSGREITNENVAELGYFILSESFHNNQLNEGLFDWFGGLFGNLGGNVKEQLKEWLIGKVMDWFLKPFIGKIGGEDGQLYEHMKRYIQITFADMPFTEIVSTVTNCASLTKLLILGFFEYVLAQMLSKLKMDGIIMNTIRQELDRVFIEDSSFIDKITNIVDEVVCNRTSKLADKLRNFGDSEATSFA